jgi:Flp pilus assembly protein TadD
MNLRIAILLTALILAGCRSLTEPPVNPGAPAANASGETPSTPPPPRPAATRHYQLGSAASALVAQAHSRAAAGDYVAATATLERALRIEPENPLAWIELGRVQLAAGNPAQADSMGRKAVALAEGDPSAQTAAWRLVADSFRARNRNEEAASADARAEALAPR